MPPPRKPRPRPSTPPPDLAGGGPVSTPTVSTILNLPGTPAYREAIDRLRVAVVGAEGTTADLADTALRDLAGRRGIELPPRARRKGRPRKWAPPVRVDGE